MSQSPKLRQILEQQGILILPGVYDCLSAKLAEQIGFEVVFTSGFGISGSTLGKPDYGFLTATEMLYSVGRIAESISIPLVADIDTGYGNPLSRLLMCLVIESWKRIFRLSREWAVGSRE